MVWDFPQTGMLRFVDWLPHCFVFTDGLFPLSRLACSFPFGDLTQNVIKSRPCAWFLGLIPHFIFEVCYLLFFLLFFLSGFSRLWRGPSLRSPGGREGRSPP